LNRHADSGVADGLFGVAYALLDANDIPKQHRRALVDHLTWFTKHLRVPARFNRSASKGYYRRKTKGIAWFRDDALEHISRMFEMKNINHRVGLHNILIL
jgi:hypothetical protein